MFKNWEMSHFKRIQIFLKKLSSNGIIFPFPFDKADTVLCATVIVTDIDNSQLPSISHVQTLKNPHSHFLLIRLAWPH